MLGARWAFWFIIRQRKSLEYNIPRVRCNVRIEARAEFLNKHFAQ